MKKFREFFHSVYIFSIGVAEQFSLSPFSLTIFHLFSETLTFKQKIFL